MSRTTKCGYWKATGSDKRISSSTNCNGNMVGLRKTLVFYEGKSSNGSRTNWILHEYCLINVDTSPNNSTQNYGNEIGDWVLCRLSMRKRSLEYGSTSTHNNNATNSRLMFDFMMVNNNKTCSSTSSSCSSSSNNNIEVSSNHHQDGYADF
ncbi:NAC domain-containing protein [Trifolium repens]|nr:NAC domain-containing protein [Trifolium repens]